MINIFDIFYFFGLVIFLNIFYIVHKGFKEKKK